MMKLFAVRHKTDKTKPQPPFFADKMKAKQHRATLGDEFVVTPGPDHRKYNGAK